MANQTNSSQQANSNSTSSSGGSASATQQQQSATASTSQATNLSLAAVAQQHHHHQQQQQQQQQHILSNGVFDFIACKLITPYHVINDPRLLDCGFSACYSCILACKDSDKNLKCIFCNSIHKIDVNKLQHNKNLQSFLKVNSKQNFNQNFLKQFEDSIYTFDDKFQSQNTATNNTSNSNIDSLEQYINSFENDVQIKFDGLKTSIDKTSEQILQNIKSIRKELHKKLTNCHKEYESKFDIYKQLIETTNQTMKEKYENGDALLNTYQLNNLFSSNIIDPNKLQQQQVQPQLQQLQLHNHTILQQQQRTGLNHHTQSHQAAQQSHITQHQHQPQQQQQQQHFNTQSAVAAAAAAASAAGGSQTVLNTANVVATTNASKAAANNILNDNQLNLNAINGQANNFSFSSSSFNEDLDEFDSDLNTKPVNLQSQKRHLNKEQAQFNKFVREEVTKRFGENFLLQHEVNQLESSIMDIIKNEAISSYLPKNTSPARAWTLAKVSLRSLKRDLRRKQTHLYTPPSSKKSDCQKMLSTHSYYDSSGLH